MRLARRDFLTLSSLAFAGAWVRVPVRAQAAQAPQTTFTDLRRGVGFFTGNGGTIGWLATPDGALVVDSQMPQTAAACIAGVKQRSPKGIELLLNTHHHGDHTAGNVTFRPAVKRIVQHENCAKWQKQIAEKDKTGAQQAYADQTFATDWKTTLGGETVTATYFGAAHTSGDVVVHFERADVVHVGDLVFNGVHPFIDRPAGASIANWITVLERVSKKHGNATYIFGHGKAVTGASKDLLAFRDYLAAALEHTRKEIAAGRSREQIATLQALRGFAEYASPIPLLSLANVLGVAYDELTGK